MTDGRTFYYSDYNFKGHKFYRDEQHWACCSGTLPQVAADYRINTYFRNPRGVWVNLYIPSTLRWNQDGADVVLTQRSEYPFESLVQFDVETSRAMDFALSFRIPAWASGATIAVNGRRVTTQIIPGTFASIQGQWKTGDRIELELPMTMRLEAIDRQHPQIAALAFGPLVLFAMTETQPSLTRGDLLAARRIDRRRWQVRTADAPLTMLPFIDIGDEPYSTYLHVT
jgi:DUF1680 family protein